MWRLCRCFYEGGTEGTCRSEFRKRLIVWPYCFADQSQTALIGRIANARKNHFGDQRRLPPLHFEGRRVGLRMKCVALISGGKDSWFNAMQCVSNGHEIVALANLRPPSTSPGISSLERFF